MLLFKSVGLSTSVLRWYAFYLSGRSQPVIEPDDERSQLGNIGTSVPQRSALNLHKLY